MFGPAIANAFGQLAHAQAQQGLAAGIGADHLRTEQQIRQDYHLRIEHQVIQGLERNADPMALDEIQRERLLLLL